MFSLRKHYPFIFSLNAVPALLRYPKLFARYSLRTILTATPTHTPCFRHRRRSCSLPSSKRGTPPFKIYSIGRVIAPREAYIIASQFRNLPLAISHLPFCKRSELHFTVVPYTGIAFPSTKTVKYGDLIIPQIS